MPRAQFGQVANQSLRCKKRRDIEAKAQQASLPRCCVNCNGQRIERRGDAREQMLAVTIEDHRLMPSLEQRTADEPFQTLDPPA